MMDPEEAAWENRVEIVRKADFLFDGGTTRTQKILLATGVDLSPWRSAVLEVIWHQKNAWPSVTTATVLVAAVSLNPVNPGVEYLGPQLGSAMVRDSDTFPLLSSSVLSTPSGMGRLSLELTQSTLAAGSLTLSVSVALVGRLR